MDLGGAWLAAVSNDDLRRAMTDPAFDDSAWARIDVPGHWYSHPDFTGVDGPVLYRHRFDASPPDDGKRSFLTFDGIFYQGDVWLDNEYLGDTEGYFFPHTFEVTDALRARAEHVLAVEVACPPPEDRRAKRTLTGVFQHWDCIDPAWNPGGIWAGVGLRETGPVRIRYTKVLCREANEDRATLELEAELDTPEPIAVTVVTRVVRDGMADPATVNVSDQDLAAGTNIVRWRVAVERPALWWPWALGEQPLYRVEIDVHAGSGPGDGSEPSDGRVLVTGLRQVRVRNFIATVNGERLFLKGINCAPTRRALAEATKSEFERDVALARQAGLDLLRVHAHISRPEFYAAADRDGMLIWQDLPLQWGYSQVRRQAAAQARQAVNLLGHHPSIAVWCGHNEPLKIGVAPGGSLAPRAVARLAAGMVLPSYNKTALDRSIKRALERADGSREVVAHSGVVPHPAWGTDSHFYYGWYHGDERDFPRALARLPVLARFVSEFGAQAVPETADFLRPERWPDLDWEKLEAHHCLQGAIFSTRVPPSAYPTFDGWKKATQDYQATVLRHHIETLRRLKYRPTGGFCVFMLGDAQPAVTWSVLDHERVPKAGYWAVADACAPVIVVADRPAPLYRAGERIVLDVHAVSDLRLPLAGVTAEAVLHWPGGRQAWRFSGDIGADACVRIGRLNHVLGRDTPTGPLTLELSLRWDDGQATNSYLSRVLGEK
jgi:beta-mannosidase